MKKISLIITSVAIIFANTLSLDDIITTTLKNYDDMNSFYAEFEQVMCDEVTGACVSYHGKIHYLKPCFFRMQMDQPELVYVGDSASLWIYLPEKKRAIRQNLKQVPFQINPDHFLKDYESRFNAELTREDESTYEITLTPKDDTDIYAAVIVIITKKKFEIRGITITDAAGSESKFIFNKVEVNRDIDKKIFEFSPPEGTQVDEY